MNRPRGYGHHESEEFETLAEAERQDDGTISIRLVNIDKRPAGETPGPSDSVCTCVTDLDGAVIDERKCAAHGSSGS